VIVLATAESCPPGNGSSRDLAAVLLIGIPAALVVLQPDLGTALMICAGSVP
jgi:rod shape determining protein RodA